MLLAFVVPNRRLRTRLFSIAINLALVYADLIAEVSCIGVKFIRGRSLILTL